MGSIALAFGSIQSMFIVQEYIFDSKDRIADHEQYLHIGSLGLGTLLVASIASITILFFYLFT